MKKLILLSVFIFLGCEAETETCTCEFQKAYIEPNGNVHILETAPANMYKCDDLNTWGWRPVNNSQLKYRYFYECE